MPGLEDLQAALGMPAAEESTGGLAQLEAGIAANQAVPASIEDEQARLDDSFAPFVGFGKPEGMLDRQVTEGVDYFAMPDFRGMSNTLAGSYERAGASGLAGARGRLAKMGLGGTGAEVATEAYAGNLAGRSQADLEMKMEMAKMDFNTLQQQRKNIYNQAQAAHKQGNAQFAQQLIFQYEALTAEMNSRKDEGSGGFFSNLLDNVSLNLGPLTIGGGGDD